MSTISRQTTWASLQILTATALNLEFDNIVNAWNNQDAGTNAWTVANAASFLKSGNTVITPMQLVAGTSTTAFTTASATFANSNLTASITPKSTSSKILVLASGVLADAGADTAYATLARGGTNLLGAAGGAQIAVGGANVDRPVSLIYLDSPASVASLTYTVQVRNSAGAVNVTFGATNLTQYMLLVELL